MKTNYRDLFNLTDCEVFILGGSGLNGSQIVNALEEFGASITVFDLDIKKKKKRLKNQICKV